MAAPRAYGWPVRGIWTWPLAAAAVSSGDILRELLTQSASVPTAALALCTAASLGAWPAALHLLIATLMHRRERVIDVTLSDRTWARLATSACFSVALVLLAHQMIPGILALATEHPIDYPQTAVALWRSGVWLVGPISALACFMTFRRCEDVISRHQLGRAVARTAGTVALVAAISHFSGGAFFIYFGAPLAIVLVLVSGCVVASYLPGRVAGPRGAGSCLLAIAVTALGIYGLRDVETRALLLHDKQISPHLVNLGLGWLDRDGDGDFPTYLGGGDCDDNDPDISIARPEIPGNGIDDNCFDGDRPSPSHVVSARSPVHPRTQTPLLIVTIDTVRADHLELYGYARATMPALTALGGQALVFEQAYAPANHTFYSMMAILSGQSPEQMLAGDPANSGLRYTQWLPQTLRNNGYYVVAINSPLVVDGKLPATELRVDELEVGTFDYVGKNRGTTAKQVADAAILRIQNYRGAKPLALWIHFMDPHAVHESPIRFPVHSQEDAYDNELSWVDFHLSRILGAAHERWGDDAVIALTSDHGEEFGETDDWGHGFTLRDRELHVPLLIKAPGLAAARRSEVVSVLGLASSITELIGVGREETGGYPSLLHPNAAPVIAHNPAFLWNETRMEAALIESTMTLVWCRTRNTYLLFDRAADPQQRHNLAGEQPEQRDRMLRTLRNALETP